MTDTAFKTIFESPEDMQAYIGKEVGLSEWLTVNQEMISQFGELTKDEQWIHCDPERAAKESPFKKTIAHGFLSLSMFTWFLENCIILKGIKMGLNYGFDKIRFINTVQVDARVRGRINLIGIDQKEDSLKFKYQVTVEIEGEEKPAIVAEWLGMAFF